MGFFGDIISDAKRKVEEESAPAISRIESAPRFKMACRVFLEYSPRSKNILVKAKITSAMRRRINETDDRSELYEAFEFIFRLGQRNRDMYAMNLSQWIGERLEDLGDSRVKVIENSDGDKRYKPRGY